MCGSALTYGSAVVRYMVLLPWRQLGIEVRPLPAAERLFRLLGYEVVKAGFHFESILVALDDHSLLEGVVPDHLSVAFHRDDALAHGWQPASELQVGVELVAEAALQTATHSRQLRGVERQALLLRHFHRDRVELRQPRRAAQLAAARPNGADHLRLIPGADLFHLDARVQHVREVTDELPEVDPLFRRKAEDDLRPVEDTLGLDELHFQAELAGLVRALRHVEAALGDGEKRPMPSEADTRRVARKSLVAARAIPAGQRLTADLVTVKRPGTGVSPADLDRVLGRTVVRALAADEVIDWTALGNA